MNYTEPSCAATDKAAATARPVVAVSCSSLVQQPACPLHHPRPAFELRSNASCCHPYSCALCHLAQYCNRYTVQCSTQTSILPSPNAPPALLKLCPSATTSSTSSPAPLTQRFLHPEPPCLGSLLSPPPALSNTIGCGSRDTTRGGSCRLDVLRGVFPDR